MEAPLPEVYLARHGETAWTISRQHTGRTDIPLLAQDEDDAIQLGQRLEGVVFTKVLVSPL
jgi:broad specificity phosphatase PhoE